MNEKIKKLIEHGCFDKCELNEFGHGSFKREVFSSESANFKIQKQEFEQPKKLLKMTDGSVSKKLEIEYIFCKIKDIILKEGEPDLPEAVLRYKTLVGQIQGQFELCNDQKLRSLFEYIVFNLKFHYLGIEAKLMRKSINRGKEFYSKHFLYFLKQYEILTEICNNSSSDEFIIVPLYKLEDIIKYKIEKAKQSKPKV